jgi:hypothetical protein
MTYGDIQHRTAFQNAIFKIAGFRFPRRKILDQVGEQAARLAGRKRVWHGSHLYVLLHPEKWPNYKIHADLFNAVLKLAGFEALSGREQIRVYAHHVRAGAVVFGHSRKCARRRCAIHFVSDAAGRLYCSEQCKRQTENFRRKQRRLALRLRRRKGNRKRMHT